MVKKQAEGKRKPEPKWGKTAKLSEIITKKYTTPEQKHMIEKAFKVLREAFLFSVEDWEALSSEQKKQLPVGLVILFDRVTKEPPSERINLDAPVRLPDDFKYPEIQCTCHLHSETYNYCPLHSK